MASRGAGAGEDRGGMLLLGAMLRQQAASGDRDGSAMSIERLMNDIAVVGGAARLPATRVEAVARAFGADAGDAEGAAAVLGRVVDAAANADEEEEEEEGAAGGGAVGRALAGLAGGDGELVEEIRRCIEKNQVRRRACPRARRPMAMATD